MTVRRFTGAPAFLITPDFEIERAVNGIEAVDHRPGEMPSALLVKFCGARIADRAGEPGRLDAALRHLHLRVRDQRGRDARAARCRCDIKLVEFIALQHRKTQWRALRADHPHIGERCGHPFGKIFKRARTRQRRRQDRGVGILPAVIPQARQHAGFGGVGGSWLHRVYIILCHIDWKPHRSDGESRCAD